MSDTRRWRGRAMFWMRLARVLRSVGLPETADLAVRHAAAELLAEADLRAAARELLDHHDPKAELECCARLRAALGEDLARSKSR